MEIAITGADGTVGEQALAAFEGTDHTVTPITHDESEDLESEVADVTDPDQVGEVLAGQDAVIHLAANPSPEADWGALNEVNVDGTYNVYEAAVENVSIASSSPARTTSRTCTTRSHRTSRNRWSSRRT